MAAITGQKGAVAAQTRIHMARIGEALGQAGGQASDFVSGMAQALGQVTSDPSEALRMAQGEFAHAASRIALTSAFDEVFQMMAWVFVAALVLVPLCKAPPLPAPRAPKAPDPTDAH